MTHGECEQHTATVTRERDELHTQKVMLETHIQNTHSKYIQERQLYDEKLHACVQREDALNSDVTHYMKLHADMQHEYDNSVTTVAILTQQNARLHDDVAAMHDMRVQMTTDAATMHSQMMKIALCEETIVKLNAHVAELQQQLTALNDTHAALIDTHSALTTVHAAMKYEHEHDCVTIHDKYTLLCIDSEMMKKRHDTAMHQQIAASQQQLLRLKQQLEQQAQQYTAQIDKLHAISKQQIINNLNESGAMHSSTST